VPELVCLGFRAVAGHPAHRDQSWSPLVAVVACGGVAPPGRSLSHPLTIEHMCEFDKSAGTAGSVMIKLASLLLGQR
jgi:hypothetical protein